MLHTNTFLTRTHACTHIRYMMPWDHAADAPLIYVRFPHIVMADSHGCCLQTTWALTPSGFALRDINTGSYGNMHNHHLTLKPDFQPVIAPGSIARAAFKMTMSWVQYEERESEEVQCVRTEVDNLDHWNPTLCFPDRWPNTGKFDPKASDGGRPG